MEKFHETTLQLMRGDSLPAWYNPDCDTRWDGEKIPNGEPVTVVARCERLDESELGSEWWIVRWDLDDGTSLFAPAEIHDHLGVR